MPARSSFDYAILRVVPRVEREEFVNAGVLLHCFERGFLHSAVALDEARLKSLWPVVDLETVRSHLGAIERIAAGNGPIGKLPPKERFRWLVAPRSTIIQASPVHAGLCEDPARALEHLLDTMVRVR